MSSSLGTTEVQGWSGDTLLPSTLLYNHTLLCSCVISIGEHPPLLNVSERREKGRKKRGGKGREREKRDERKGERKRGGVNWKERRSRDKREERGR